MAVPGRLLLLVPTQSYRADDFLAAARRLGVEVVVGTDRCHRIEEAFGPSEGLLSLDYRNPEEAAVEIEREAARRPISGVVPADDGTAVIAALALERLGLPRNPPAAARRTKGVSASASSVISGLVDCRSCEAAAMPGARTTSSSSVSATSASAIRGCVRCDRKPPSGPTTIHSRS